MHEEWRDIAGYEGLYQVSNLGRVKSLDRYVPHKTFGKKFCKGCLMATHTNNAGYATVNLCKGNQYKSIDVHRLVAEAFIPNPNNLEVVNHKDENKKNNLVENLEWCTETYNNSYGTCRKRGSAKLKKIVLQCLAGVVVKEWESATDAELAIVGRSTGAISRCIRGKSKTAYGYEWKFKN